MSKFDELDFSTLSINAVLLIQYPADKPDYDRVRSVAQWIKSQYL